ncbi:hypothetical protein GCM10010103_31640 [Streptomyces paradoxus]|uniref:Uncharacterized protein n=1 Tax=Streptomyces paradoxus TaxID=66375 RepID=A0A7W9TB27_9ACTN|nr:hypothetical protein [Streptomyces paradoxus]MBB6077379.1 hypothetical protein [Streptomyces paradoxus]
MTELLRCLAAWAGFSCRLRRAHHHALRDPLLATGVSSPRIPPLPVHRSPYCADVVIDGTSTVAVRPYLVAHEQQQWRKQGETTSAWPGAVLYPAAGIEAA